MVDGLRAFGVGVDDDAEPVFGDALLFGGLFRELHHLADQLGRGLEDGGYALLRDHEEMYRRLRVDVVDGERVFRLGDPFVFGDRFERAGVRKRSFLDIGKLYLGEFPIDFPRRIQPSNDEPRDEHNNKNQPTL